jgi:hypothetical protein
MIQMLSEIAAFFQNSLSGNLRKPVDNNAKRFTSGMHVNGIDLYPVFRRLPPHVPQPFIHQVKNK